MIKIHAHAGVLSVGIAFPLPSQPVLVQHRGAGLGQDGVAGEPPAGAAAGNPLGQHAVPGMAVPGLMRFQAAIAAAVSVSRAAAAVKAALSQQRFVHAAALSIIPNLTKYTIVFFPCGPSLGHQFHINRFVLW